MRKANNKYSLKLSLMNLSCKIFFKFFIPLKITLCLYNLYLCYIHCMMRDSNTFVDDKLKTCSRT